jgi:uncharacterized protein
MAAKGKKTPARKKTPVKRTSFSGARAIFWVAAFGLTLAALTAILFLPHKDTPSQREARQPVDARPEFAAGVPEKTRTFIYEESIGADFDLRVWEADMAIIQTLSLYGQEDDRMIHKKVEPRFFYGTPYHFQEITIYTNIEHDRFMDRLRENLSRFLKDVSLKPEIPEHRWSIWISGHNTHIVNLERIYKKPPSGTGKLVIIIDDLGENLKYARELGKLEFPVIFSILPYTTRTTEVVDFARKNNLEIMLHLPMEPSSYSQGVCPGQGALFVDMDDREVKARLAQNLAQVPGAIGVNNHMGSRFTQDHQGMSIVLEELKKEGLFFLDSLTTSKSVVEELAGKKQVDFLKRHVFLDNVQDKNAILFQLNKAENLAIKQGMAVAIGHPYPETLMALKEWKALRSGNVEVVRISEYLATLKYKTASRLPLKQ